ncbi:hypothetical protein FIU87_01905 [Bacillus sp. THAF10]|uniref:Imm26 family immunity protein n=1 Tax=Bacillus sp. THAF10 TaxID=2587848 RepID=UPI0012691C84|nr:Imm26 family immunity protein [Bacillus sp. THAF10]QFT87394.1 hypothetical protein FIU87_01905 [Bacillus sp. THAF10]
MNEEIIKDLSVNVGFIKIHLPDYTMSTFMIAQSIADEFGVETNQQAIKKLRGVLKSSENDLYKKVKTDYESGSIFIHTSSKRGEEILQVALIINDLAIEPYCQEFAPEDISKIKSIIKDWKRPRPQKWKVGDVFTVPLSDGTYSFGQVLWETYNSPNCALFDCRGKENLPIETITSSPVFSVLNITAKFLDCFEWKVIGNVPVEITKDDVPKEHRGESTVGSLSFSSAILSELAEVYYGLKPWNSAYKQDFYDELLMPKIKRPQNIIIK